MGRKLPRPQLHWPSSKHRNSNMWTSIWDFPTVQFFDHFTVWAKMEGKGLVNVIMWHQCLYLGRWGGVGAGLTERMHFVYVLHPEHIQSVLSKEGPFFGGFRYISGRRAMHTHAVERYEGSPLLYAGEKDLVLCVPELAIIMSSCWINQQWWAILRERHASVRIIKRGGRYWEVSVKRFHCSKVDYLFLLFCQYCHGVLDSPLC